MSELQLTLRFTIDPVKLEAFKRLARQCMDVTREQDTGTLQYDWFFNPDETQCVVHERYRDSTAVLEHAAHLGELMGRFMGISAPEIEICGAPTDELLTAIAMLQPRVYSAFQSL